MGFARIFNNLLLFGGGKKVLDTTASTPTFQNAQVLDAANNLIADLSQTDPQWNFRGGIAGINAMAHSNALTALFPFDGSLHSTRGLEAMFTRNSPANNPVTLKPLANYVPAFVPSKFGQGLSVWEGTTNLVYNSDFETVTTTNQLFSDPLTEYSGSSAAPWTVQGGSFTFSSSGATSGATNSTLTAGNPNWVPLLGSDGSSNLPLTAEVTVTTPSTLSSNNNGAVILWIDGNDYYTAWLTNTAFVLTKVVVGTATNLASTTATTPAASTAYTLTLELDHLGNLTAKWYSGSGTGGTLLQTLTATDTSLTGPFLLGIRGDTGVVLTNASMKGPMANGWSYADDGIGSGGMPGAVSLAQISANGTYGASIVRANGSSGDTFIASSHATVSSSTTYTVSLYANAISLPSGSNAGIRIIEWDGTTIVVDHGMVATVSSATHGFTRLTYTFTTQSTTNALEIRGQLNGSGYVVFDCVQVEQKPWPTPYLQNNSISASATRDPEVCTVPLINGPTTSSGTIAGWFTPENTTFDSSGSKAFYAFEDSAGAFAVSASGTTWSFVAGGGTAATSPIGTGEGIPVHLALVWNGSSFWGYVNGVQVASGTQGATALGSLLYVATNNGGAYHLDGVVDSLCIFNVALTPAEVYSLYAATQPLIDGLANPVAQDVESYNVYASNPDSSDTYTVVQYKRRDGTLYMQSVLSNPNSGGYYQTDTLTYYDATGTVQVAQEVWSLTYDSSGKIVSKVRVS